MAAMVERIGSVLADGDHLVGALVQELAARLRKADVGEPASEGRDIVAAVAGEGRLWPSLNRDQSLSRDRVHLARVACERRVSGAPFAYCVEKAAFRHLTLHVDANVLIPRQETEQLVEKVLRRTRAVPGGTVVDVGTGSGAIALALAGEGRFDLVVGTDISRGALNVAQRNANETAAGGGLGCPIEFVCCDTLSGVSAGGLRVVVSNPPYITFDEARSLPPGVRDWEPSVALFSADGGMAITRRIVRRGVRALAPGGLLALEVDTRRASAVAELVLSTAGFTNVSVEYDLAGRERFVLALKEN
jgi:release factor glutamine methyltransferase